MISLYGIFVAALSYTKSCPCKHFSCFFVLSLGKTSGFVS